MQPGWVWLQLIPLFGQIWQFVVVIRIAGSVRNQWQAADEDSILGISAEAADNSGNKKPTMGIGIAFCTLNVLMVFFNLFTKDGAPTLSGSLALASMICWIVYWVQLASWKRRLKNKATLAI